MTAPTTPAHLPPRTWLYFLAQSINLTTAVMSVSMAALVGAALAPAAWASTIPYGCQFLLVMLGTLPASRLMARWGRRPAFLLACAPLALSGVTGFLAIEHRQFGLLILSHALLGLYISFANFNRFAATDGLDAAQRPRAISLVVAGGLIAAFTGPLLSKQLQQVAGLGEFAGAYLVFVALAALAFLINLMIRPTQTVGAGSTTPSSPAPGGSTPGSSTSAGTVAVGSPSSASSRPTTMPLLRTVFRDPGTRLAVLIAALGYGLMNLLMIQTSIQLSTGLCSSFGEISQAIQWHVVAMFAPSLIAGRLVQRVGAQRLALLGVVLTALSAGLNLVVDTYGTFVLALVILGLGWNFTYVGGSALFAEHSAQLPHAVELQGINDLAISVLATAGAFSPALLHATLGWQGSNLLAILLCLVPLGLALRVYNKSAR
ncbi:MAG: MFS transporter [Lautropia sp.]|nr:MFS transporter [Lautropia sp.]